MAKATIPSRPATAISQTASQLTTAAQVSFAATAAFVVLLAALHIIKPELDPSWHFISEYAIGDNGWIMVLAFLSLALSHGALFVAIRAQVRTVPGWIGMALLLVSAAGLTMAGIFTTDPITASPDALTTEGYLHNLGGTLGLAMPFAYAFIGWSLARNQSLRLRSGQAWYPARRVILFVTGLAWVGFLASFLSLGVMLSQSGGQYGPGVLVGWPNRLEMLAYSVWLMVVAWLAVKISRNGAD